MEEYSYLIFSLNNYFYGINTVYVEEIFSLPELTPIPEAPREIIGVVNLRGDIVSVIDLNLTLGYQSPDYSLTDSVVVLSWEKSRLGIIVNQVHEVKNIFSDEITTELNYEQEAVVEQTKIITGLARISRDIFILSNPENWLDYLETKNVSSFDNFWNSEIPSERNAEELQSNSSELLLTQKSFFCLNATLEERTIFRQRSDDLKLLASHNLKSFITLAVIALNGNFFGINLEMVREFTNIRQVTPIPCCPAHIVGNMNLRGEILTLIDIGGLFNLPMIGIADNSKVMVVEFEGIVAGVVVEEVCDVMFSLNIQEIMAVPTANYSINHEYLQGVALYLEKIMSIVDLPKIFLKGVLIVDEVI